jgi:microcystin-dependent protein
MSDQFVGEIRAFGFNFAPTGWALCNGQLLPISQNTALFSLLGTMYGGDGKTTFALPNLQACAPLNAGQGPGLSNYDQGQTGGEAAITLLLSQMPVHAHAAFASPAGGGQAAPQGNVWGTASVGRQSENRYAQASGTSPSMNAVALAPAGGGQPHNNMPPYCVLNFCIALQGIYPPRS